MESLDVKILQIILIEKRTGVLYTLQKNNFNNENVAVFFET